jgi:hypothetical protein
MDKTREEFLMKKILNKITLMLSKQYTSIGGQAVI